MSLCSDEDRLCTNQTDNFTVKDKDSFLIKEIKKLTILSTRSFNFDDHQYLVQPCSSSNTTFFMDGKFCIKCVAIIVENYSLHL